MTVEEKIEAGLFAYAAALDLNGDPPLAWPNIAFTPPDGPYVQVVHFPNRNARVVVNSDGPHLRQGILQMTVVAPLDGGPSDATALAGAIAEYFPADLDLFEDGIRIRIQQAPDVLPAEKTDVSWDARVDVRYETFA